MNKLERLTGILLVLQERSLTAAQIAAHFEVSRRTVLRDIQALSELGVPVEAIAGPGGGYRLSESYLLAPLPLTAREAALLLLSLSTLSRLGDVPFAAEHASLHAKIRALLPDPLPEEVARLLAVLSVDVPERQQRTPFLESLVKAAQRRQAVRVVYRSAERQSTQHLLPLAVTTQNGFWYCRAYAFEHEEERTYRVDRIQALMPVERTLDPAHLPEPTPYADASHPQVVARLTARGVADVESEPHLGQLIQREADGSGRLALRCPPGELNWYARYFAGLGAEVDVLAPPELRDRLRQLGERLAAQYRDAGPPQRG